METSYRNGLVKERMQITEKDRIIHQLYDVETVLIWKCRREASDFTYAGSENAAKNYIDDSLRFYHKRYNEWHWLCIWFGDVSREAWDVRMA